MEAFSESLSVQLEDFFANRYRKQIERLSTVFPEKRSLDVDFEDLDHYSAELADQLLAEPDKFIQACRKAVASIGALTLAGKKLEAHICFHNLPPERSYLIRDLTADLVNRFISVEGQVSKITVVMPKVDVATFQCKRCHRVYKMPQPDKNKLNTPAVCACDHRDFELLVDESEFMDVQKAEIQEPIELLKGGDQAKNIVLWLLDDQTNKLVAGDKVIVSGILRINPPQKTHSSIYSKYLDAVSVLKKEKEFAELDLEPEDVREIKRLSRDQEIYKKIVASIAPSIFGYDEIKEAIALQLFGGSTRKVMPDGSKIRPDIHLLLIGDPGVAKSRLLQYVDNLAPKSIYVSGKSTSGAGLTATAEKDEFGEGGWTLKAGAMVLASGGMVMIDEFDKMTREDRAALHEAMESQTISIAKAGIVTRFSSKTAILAAANPKYGRFDPYTPPSEQFDIPPTILSRFDLIFPVRDVLEEDKDKDLATHILKSHLSTQMRAHNLMKKTSEYDVDEIDRNEEAIKPAIDPLLLKKYISFARKNVNPVMTQAAMEKFKNFYVELRSVGEQQGSVPITPRQLEALVRLGEASAKLRLSEKLNEDDAERAIKLVKYVMMQVGMDKETGRFDVDIIATGQPKSKMDRLRSLYNIIKRLNKEKEEVTHEMIVKEGGIEGIEANKIEELLGILRKNGDIYSPRPGIYRVAEET